MPDINDIPWSSEVLARLKTPVTVDVGLSASDHMDALVDALNDRLGCHWGVLGSFPMANNKRAKSAIVEVAIGIHLRLGVEDNEYVQSVQREGTVEYISATGGGVDTVARDAWGLAFRRAASMWGLRLEERAPLPAELQRIVNG